MIYYIKGSLELKSTDKIVIDVNGIGYFIHIPLSTYQKLPEKGMDVKVFIYHHVREDAINLFGFYSLEERDLFELLISVSSIGAKSAINILSTISVNDFKNAITTGNISLLTTISGIGKKTAQRMILELKDKIGTIVSGTDECFSTDSANLESKIFEDSIEALISLGYKIPEARNAILHAYKEIGDSAKTEDYITCSLKYLGK